MLPYLPTIYTEAKIAELAQAWVPLAQKHGWDLNTWLAAYSEELAFALVLGPTLPPLIDAHKRFLAEREQKEAPAPDPTS